MSFSNFPFYSMKKKPSHNSEPTKKPITYGFDLEYTSRHSAEQLILSVKYLEDGLIPPTVNIKEALSQMTYKEARTSKRKFRKIFRKLRKTVEADSTGMHWGREGKAPTKHQKLRRKMFVEAKYIMDMFGME